MHTFLSPDRKIVTPLGLALALGISAAVSSVSAVSVVNGSFDTLAGFGVSDLELTDGSASDHWAIFGQLGSAPSSNGDTLVTRKTLSSPFSSASRINGAFGGTYANLGGRIKFNHAGGFDVDSNPVSSVSGNGPASDAFGAAVQGNTGLISITFDYTMQGTDENLSIYLFNFDSAPTVDVSAIMDTSGGSYSDTSVVLPSSTSNNVRLGVLQLEISGASIGETMSFTVSSDYSSNGSSTNFWGLGLAGASSEITAVPEPSAFAFLAGVFGLGLVIIRRRR